MSNCTVLFLLFGHNDKSDDYLYDYLVIFNHVFPPGTLKLYLPSPLKTPFCTANSGKTNLKKMIEWLIICIKKPVNSGFVRFL